MICDSENNILAFPLKASAGTQESENMKQFCYPYKGAFTNPPGPVRFSNPAACRRISRPVRGPSELHFYGVHGHISNGARTMPGRYKFTF